MPHDGAIVAGGVMLPVLFVIFQAMGAAGRALIVALFFSWKKTAREKLSDIRFA
jgi:hypothetical protein